jgi:serine protease Do
MLKEFSGMPRCPSLPGRVPCRLAVLALFLVLPAAWADEGLPPVFEKPAPENIEELKAIQQQLKKVLARVMPAVVGVQVGGSSGSGVIVTADGYVLTAGHVSGKPDQAVVLILPDGKRIKGKSLGNNKGVDSGMFKITDPAPEGGWPHVDMGHSADLKKGQWCIAIGHPGGYKKGRSPVVRLGRVLDFNASSIRTDCTLVGGDSGGPLFDMEGRVIGIHSRIGGTLTFNIHVPVDTFRATWDRLAAGEAWSGRPDGGGRPAPIEPYLGLNFAPNGKDCRISEVIPNSPADKAGLKAQDLIKSIDGQAIGNADEFSAVLLKKKPGDEVTIVVSRDGEVKNFKVTLGKKIGG